MGARGSKRSYDTTQPPPNDGDAAAPSAFRRTDGTADETPPGLRLCQPTDLDNGQMREFNAYGKKILLLKDEEGRFFATGNKCSHYSAQLVNGVYCKGRVRCPWHGASFDVATGDIEDFPGLDSIPTFKVSVQGDGVYLEASEEEVAVVKRVKPLVAPDAASAQSVVIVGGGGSAMSCAETLRQEGFVGRVQILTQEPNLPYDRPKLSKVADAQVDTLLLRKADYLEQHGIEVQTNCKVVAVDVAAKAVETADGDRVGYTHLVLATGGVPRRLRCPGADLRNVCYLRTPQDGQAMAKLVEGKRVVVIGSSFIGMELAAFATARKASSVAVVGSSRRPFGHIFSQQVGAVFQKLHESNGVTFHLESGVNELRGEDGELTEVVLADGSALPADVCIVGIGVTPATELLRDSGVEMDERGFVRVDRCMRTSQPHVFACGDITLFPLDTFHLDAVNVQHWQMALKHGKTAGAAIAGKERPIVTVPYFWSMMFGKSIRYTGYGAGFDEVVVHGSLDELKFVAYYLKEEKLVAVGTLMRDPVCSQVAECFRVGVEIKKSDIDSNESDDWSAYLHAPI